jgi:hypothetical protein
MNFDESWVNPDILPDWGDIHENVLSEARRTAARVFDKTRDIDPEDAITPTSKGVSIGGEHLGATDFMTKIGMDPRFILMTTQWVDEYRSTVEQLMHMYIAEVVSSLQALSSAEAEEINFDG